jgi:hypothetical protein
MKKNRYTEEQIIGILKQHEAGVKTADLCLRSECAHRHRAEDSAGMHRAEC